MNFRRLTLALVGIVALAIGAGGVAESQSPPPPPPVLTTPVAPTLSPQAIPSAIPTATPTPGRPRRGRRTGPGGTSSPSPAASTTPQPPAFTTLDGVWEIELQPLNTQVTIYSHMIVVQHGTGLSGYWEHGTHNVHASMTGTYDGRLITMSVATPAGAQTFSGYVENNEDMVGLYKTSAQDEGTPFTAEHRAKEKR